jgi:hypothetical protein
MVEVRLKATYMVGRQELTFGVDGFGWSHVEDGRKGSESRWSGYEESKVGCVEEEAANLTC